MTAGRLALLLLAATPAVAVAFQNPQIEPVLVDLKLGRLASRTVPAHRSGDTPLIPLFQFLELAELGRKQGADGSLTTTLQPGNVTVTVDPGRRRLVVAGEERPLGPTELLVQNGEIFVSTSVLSRIADLRWQTSWADLEVVLANPENLPIARRYRREAVAAARLATVPGVEVQGWLRDPPSVVDGVVADYNVLVPTDPGPDGGSYAFGMGLNVLNGSLEGRVQNQGSVKEGNVRVDVGWTKVWRDNRWLSQVRLGDGYSSGPRIRALRGVAVGNVPFRRPAIVGELPFAGTLGPGWQVEAYRGGRLISFDSVNTLGQYSIDVPIQYGENPVDFLAYGPFGEVRQFSQTYRVPVDVVPAGRFEYGVSLGACRAEAPCQATGNLDARYGLSTRWTIEGGVDQFWRDTLPDLLHPYIGITGTLTNAIGIEAEVVNDAVARGLLRIEPSVGFQFLAEATRFAEDVTSPILTPEGRRQQYTLFSRVQPFGSNQGWFYLDASVDWIKAVAENSTTARLGASFQPGQIRLIPSFRWRTATRLPDGVTTTQRTWGVNAVVLPLQQLGRVLGQVTLRGNIDLDTPFDPYAVSAYASRPLSRYLRLELGGSWFRGERASLSAFFTANLPQARAYTTVERPATGEVRATEFVQGSLLYDRAFQKVSLSPGPAIQQGAVSGRVFMDMNDDGKFNPGEYVLPDVRVTVGINSERTNQQGEFRISQLPAYERLLASIDTTTLASPLWLPAFGAIEFETQPNRFVTLNIPVLSGGVIDGRVMRQAPEGNVPVPGATLILRHLKSGRTRSITTFSDGGFYALSIRPGEWEIRVDPSVVARFGTRSDPVYFNIKPTLQGESLSGITLQIR
jgi:hypothetical protein